MLYGLLGVLVAGIAALIALAVFTSESDEAALTTPAENPSVAAARMCEMTFTAEAQMPDMFNIAGTLDICMSVPIWTDVASRHAEVLSDYGGDPTAALVALCAGDSRRVGLPVCDDAASRGCSYSEPTTSTGARPAESPPYSALTLWTVSGPPRRGVRRRRARTRG